MTQFLNMKRLMYGALTLLFMATTLTAARAAGADSTELVRQRVRIQDKRLRDMLQAMPEDADFAYRQIVIRKLSSEIGVEFKELLFAALRGYMAERGLANQNDLEKTSYVDSVRIYAAVSGDSVDVFSVEFFSQRDSTYQKTVLDRKTGETVNRTEVMKLIRQYKMTGRACYDGLREQFTTGVYKGISVGDVMSQEFLSPLNSEIVDVYGGFGNYGDKIVLDPAQRLKFYNLFTGFYDVLPVYDTINVRDTTIYVEDRSSNPPKLVPKAQVVYDALVLSKKVQPDFSEPLLDFSLLHQITINPFSDKSFGFQARLGNDEVGLPFWSSGTGQAMLILRNKIFDQSILKVGAVFPFGVGESSSSSLFRARGLAGGWGFAAEGLFPSFNVPAGLNLPLGFSMQYVPPFQKNGTIIDTTRGATVYYASFIGTVYFPFIVNLDPQRNTSFVQLQIGLGWEDINESVLMYPGFVDPGNGFDTVKIGDSRVDQIHNRRVVSSRATPHIRADYVNHEAAKFGAFVQYDHMWMVGAWIELFNGFRIETEYSAPLHHADPWEPQSFFLISPRIRIL